MALWFCNQIERNSKYFPTNSTLPLGSDVLARETHLLAQAAGQADDDHLGGSHAEGGHSNIVEVVSEGLREGGEASLVVEFISSRVHRATILLLIQTAGVRDGILGKSSGRDILPLSPGLDSTALEFPLNGVPGGVHTIVLRSSVVLHSLLHVGLDGGVQFGLQQESGDTGTNLSNQDDKEEEAVGVHHALVLLDGSTASEEGHHEDDASEDDDEDRSVGVVVPQEVQEISGLELDVDPEPHEDNANQSEDQVEQHDDGFEEAVTTVLHCVLYSFSEDEQGN